MISIKYYFSSKTSSYV